MAAAGRGGGRAFALFCATAAIGLGGVFDLYTTHWFTWAWTLAVPMAGAALMTLGLLFPQESRLAQRQPLVALAPFGAALLLAVYALAMLYGGGANPRAYILAWRYEYLFLGAGITIFLLTMLYRWVTSRSPITREQTQVTMLGALVALAPLLVWTGLPLVVANTAPINMAVVLPVLVLFPAAAAYAILRYRLLETDTFATQGLIYAAMAVITLAGYGLILIGLTLIVGTAIQPTHPVVIGLTIFLLVAAFNPLRERLQSLVDEAFFAGSAGTPAARNLRPGADAGGRHQRHCRRAGRAAHGRAPADPHLPVPARPDQRRVRRLCRAQRGRSAALRLNAPRFTQTDLRFAAAARWPRRCAASGPPFTWRPIHPCQRTCCPTGRGWRCWARPCMCRCRAKPAWPAGWRWAQMSGQPMTRDDLRFAEALADQSALAIERASVISDLERRVRELNVLSQMSQAVNFTLKTDDLLELIYAQASKVVGTRNFYILPKSRAAGS